MSLFNTYILNRLRSEQKAAPTWAALLFRCRFTVVLFLFFSSPLYSQFVDPYFEIEPEEVWESVNDSAIIASHFSADMTMENLLSILSEYESFDDNSIHYPKTDFTHKKDTTYLFLLPGYGQKYVHPFIGKVTSKFGPRGRFHYGTDLKLYVGDSVRSVFDGVVRISRRSPSYGYIVVVRHYNGLETYYAHLSRLLVDPEDVVKAGDVIGLGGNTGRSRGAHLHFEVRYLGAAFDPEKIIDFENYKLKSEYLEISSNTFDYLKGYSSGKIRYHKIKRGETLSSIARKYGTSVGSIQRLNKIKGTNIRAGNTIRVR